MKRRTFLKALASGLAATAIGIQPKQLGGPIDQLEAEAARLGWRKVYEMDFTDNGRTRGMVIDLIEDDGQIYWTQEEMDTTWEKIRTKVWRKKVLACHRLDPLLRRKR